VLHPRPIWFALVLATLVLPNTATAQDDDLRIIEFETTEVTAPDVAVSPDGEWLIFNILGHLFRLPVEGGTAEQLTFGPYYDTDHTISPDGSRVAFVSDRDRSDGNIFVLKLATGQITQVTHEAWAARPAWSPDGQSIVYLSLVREVPGVLPMPKFSFSAPDTVPALVRRVALGGAEPETLSAPPQVIGSVFYLPDGRLAWAAIDLEIEPETRSPSATTRIQVRNEQGTVSTLRTLAGYAAPVIPSPTGDGVYCRRFHPLAGWYTRPAEDLLFIPLPEGAERQIFRLARPRGWTPRFAVAPDGKGLYLGEGGRLWKISLPGRSHEPIAFSAYVRLEIQDPVFPRKVAFVPPGGAAPPRSVLNPRLSPDGRTLVFEAARYLWEQPLDGGQAQRLFAGNAFEREPAFSPDGRQLAFVTSEHGKEELRVFNLDTRQTRAVASGSYYWNLSWSPDGERLVFMEDPSRVVAVNLNGDDKKEKLTEAAWWWGSRPQLSADGLSLYFSGPPGAGTFYRLPLKEKARPEPLTQLRRQMTRALVSPDGKWLVFKRNTEIWIASLEIRPIREEDIRQLSADGGFSFVFTPDGSAVIYAAGNRVWRHPLAGGERKEIPIRLELERPTPSPLLVRRVRVLDFAEGGFGPETSLFIEQGRIRWIGAERDRELPQETVIVDATGRFAIPGLFDMHVHGSWTNQAVFLAYGVTSVRDLGGWLAWLNALADRGEASSDPVPRYFFTGDPFKNAQPVRHSTYLLIYDEEDARHYVRLWKQWGADFVKVYYPLSWALQRAVAEEARRQGLPMIGHGFKGIEEIIKNVTLGKMGFEHATTPGRLYDDVLQMLAAAGTRWDPTLVTRGNFVLLRDEPERLADAKLRAFTPERSIRQAQTESYFDGLRAIGENEFRGRWMVLLASVRAAHQRGVKLLAGSGAGNPGIFFGSHLHWEFEHLVQAGLPPLEVLRIATQEAAAAVGAEDELGTLEPGKLADLVLLDKNPLEDIKNTQSIWRVIKGGWLFDPEKLRPPESDSTTK